MRRREAMGAVAGVTISGLVSLAGYGLRLALDDSAIGWLALVGLYGLPVGAWLGWRLARRIGTVGGLGLVLWMGVSAAYLGVVVVVTFFAVGNVLATGDLAGAVLGWLALVLIGVVYAVPVLPITIIAAAAWYATMRLLIGLGWGRAGRLGDGHPRADPAPARRLALPAARVVGLLVECHVMSPRPRELVAGAAGWSRAARYRRSRHITLPASLGGFLGGDAVACACPLSWDTRPNGPFVAPQCG